MIWQLTKAGKALDDFFDDGLPGGPGDPDFNTDAVKAEMKAQGATGYNYVQQSPAN